jgi:hypothetical protein
MEDTPSGIFHGSFFKSEDVKTAASSWFHFGTVILREMRHPLSPMFFVRVATKGLTGMVFVRAIIYLTQ